MAKLLTIEQASKELSLGRSTTYELVQRGELRSIKVGASRRIPADAIDEFIRTKTAESNTVSG